MLENVLKIYLIAPFLFFLVLIVSKFLKPLAIRRLSKAFFFVMFFISSLILLKWQNHLFSFLNINFHINKFSSYMAFLLEIIYLLFVFYSKKFIDSKHKVFYSSTILSFGLVNLCLFCDNIFVFLLVLFWIFLLNYFLGSIFFVSKTSFQDKKNSLINNSKQLFADIFTVMGASFLISKDFIRYFLINNIDFSFTELSQNIYKINDFSIELAFFGFLILIFRLFNFMGFNYRKYDFQKSAKAYLIGLLENLNLMITGVVLFFKCYLNFDFLFFQFQNEIAILLLINFVYYIFLCLNQNDIFKFSNNIYKGFLIFAIFSVFSFEQNAFRIFLFYIFVLCLSYLMTGFVSAFLFDEFKTSKLDEFKKINDSSRLSQLFIALGFLNFVLVPILPMFSAFMVIAIAMFCTQYEGVMLNILPYFLIFGMFLICLGGVDVIRKILIEPVEKDERKNVLKTHQIFVFAILIFIMIVCGLFPDYFIDDVGFLSSLVPQI